MQGNPVCVITHRQIIEGACPWCRLAVVNGQVNAMLTARPETQWNWITIEEDLRDEDDDVRSHTVWNLSSLATCIENVLPLLARALVDCDSEIRPNAEYACSRIGSKLSDEHVPWVEEQIGVNDRELAARIVLLGKYFVNMDTEVRAKRADHIHWLIEHHPDCSVAGSPNASLIKSQGLAAYESAKELWLKQCAANKSNAIVLGNAAKFFFLNDPQMAEKLLIDAQTLEPDKPEWHEQLAHLHSLSASHGSPELRRHKARKSLVELEMAEQIRSSHSGIVPEAGDVPPKVLEAAELMAQIHALPNRARAAFEAGELGFAKQFAEECLAVATSDKIPEFFRNDGNAIHSSHLVLGRVALKEGNLERAKNHLIESGKSKGAPNLMSFGPNMSLAKDLLERGERDVVLEYLVLCEKFWKMGSQTLAQWKEQIKEGQMPKFGANLRY